MSSKLRGFAWVTGLAGLVNADAGRRGHDRIGRLGTLFCFGQHSRWQSEANRKVERAAASNLAFEPTG